MFTVRLLEILGGLFQAWFPFYWFLRVLFCSVVFRADLCSLESS